jgi:hypothetical protein
MLFLKLIHLREKWICWSPGADRIERQAAKNGQESLIRDPFAPFNWEFGREERLAEMNKRFSLLPQESLADPGWRLKRFLLDL